MGAPSSACWAAKRPALAPAARWKTAAAGSLGEGAVLGGAAVTGLGVGRREGAEGEAAGGPATAGMGRTPEGR